MNDNLVKINLHGVLGKAIGEVWDLSVKSVSEAIHAINTITKGKLFQFLKENDKNGLRYKVLINDEQFLFNKEVTEKNIEELQYSELCIKSNNLKNIDIVPLIEAANSSILGIIAGVILIIIGIILIATPFGVPLIIGGIGLIAAGVINLLSSPPKFQDFRSIGDNPAASYLFNGPENVIGEGGPVPIGYGRLIIGSLVVSASYVNTDVLAPGLSEPGSATPVGGSIGGGGGPAGNKGGGGGKQVF